MWLWESFDIIINNYVNFILPAVLVVSCDNTHDTSFTNLYLWFWSWYIHFWESFPQPWPQCWKNEAPDADEEWFRQKRNQKQYRTYSMNYEEYLRFYDIRLSHAREPSNHRLRITVRKFHRVFGRRDRWFRSKRPRTKITTSFRLTKIPKLNAARAAVG